MVRTLSRAAETIVRKSEHEIVKALQNAAEDLPPPEQADAFGRFFERYGDATVVLLGEATHGTSEFYRARAAVSRTLIRDWGFNIVAVEADWPDAGRVDRYVRHAPTGTPTEQAFARFPDWMWRNLEVEEFVEWLRRENGKRSGPERVEFRGLDIFSLQTSIAAVLAYLDKIDPEAADAARERYGCLTPWHGNPERYGRHVEKGGESCEDAVHAQLLELLQRRFEYARRNGDTFFDAVQNARIVRAAEHYYRNLYRASRESWNLRDRHMFGTLENLMRHRGPDAKVIVWAHNSHIGNAAATAMGWEGQLNIGELCRTAFGHRMVAIGFGTDEGTVAAAPRWDAPMEVMEIEPAREESFEHLFRWAAHARSLTDLRSPERENLRTLLSEIRLQRAIGAVYEPGESESHYFDAALGEQFDAYVWFETTHAVTPLERGAVAGRPDTYPFGL